MSLLYSACLGDSIFVSLHFCFIARFSPGCPFPSPLCGGLLHGPQSPAKMPFTWEDSLISQSQHGFLPTMFALSVVPSASPNTAHR